MNGIELMNACLANPAVHAGMDTTKDMFGNTLEVGSALDNAALKQVLNSNSVPTVTKLTDFEAAKQLLKKTL